MSWQMGLLLLLGGSTILLFGGNTGGILLHNAINSIGAVLFLGGDPACMQLIANSNAAVLTFSLKPTRCSS